MPWQPHFSAMPKFSGNMVWYQRYSRRQRGRRSLGRWRYSRWRSNRRRRRRSKCNSAHGGAAYAGAYHTLAVPAVSAKQRTSPSTPPGRCRRRCHQRGARVRPRHVTRVANRTGGRLQHLEEVGGVVVPTIEVPGVARHCLLLGRLVAIHPHVTVLGKNEHPHLQLRRCHVGVRRGHRTVHAFRSPENDL